MIQQRKNEELEAQLQEAEDIVRDLRDELAEVQAELDRMKSEHSRQILKPRNSCLVEDKISSYRPYEYLPPNKPSVASGATVPYPIQRNECQKCYTKMVCTCGAYIRNRDLPSIILRGKDPGLYRNGCTQRILACERNLPDWNSCLLKETDKVTDVRNDTEEMEGRHTSDTSASKGKILSELEKKLLANIDLGIFKSFPHKRKRAVRRRKEIKPLEGKEYSMLQNSILVNANAHRAENSSEIGPRSWQDETELLKNCTKATDDDSKIVDGGLIEKFESLRLIAECLPSDDKIDVGKVDVPSHSLESNPFPYFKYTFQRKRKRQALVVSEVNGACETEKKIGDEQNGDLKQEQSKPSLMRESSRECRRLAQVARQVGNIKI